MLKYDWLKQYMHGWKKTNIIADKVEYISPLITDQAGLFSITIDVVENKRLRQTYYNMLAGTRRIAAAEEMTKKQN